MNDITDIGCAIQTAADADIAGRVMRYDAALRRSRQGVRITVEPIAWISDAIVVNASIAHPHQFAVTNAYCGCTYADKFLTLSGALDYGYYLSNIPELANVVVPTDIEAFKRNAPDKCAALKAMLRRIRRADRCLHHRCGEEAAS